jgi:hypothetical protein
MRDGRKGPAVVTAEAVRRESAIAIADQRAVATTSALFARSTVRQFVWRRNHRVMPLSPLNRKFALAPLRCKMVPRCPVRESRGLEAIGVHTSSRARSPGGFLQVIEDQ